MDLSNQNVRTNYWWNLSKQCNHKMVIMVFDIQTCWSEMIYVMTHQHKKLIPIHYIRWKNYKLIKTIHLTTMFFELITNKTTKTHSPFLCLDYYKLGCRLWILAISKFRYDLFLSIDVNYKKNAYCTPPLLWVQVLNLYHKQNIFMTCFLCRG